MFCFKPHNEKSFHLYEINVDGTGLVQLTDGPYDDLDPIYLQDDQHVMFSTTRGHTYVRCMPPTNAFVLARCDRDGKNVYLISANNEPDYLPSLMNVGRVIYTRWEYTDKPLWRAQKLWTINPDGTGFRLFGSNTKEDPNAFWKARVQGESIHVSSCLLCQRWRTVEPGIDANAAWTAGSAAPWSLIVHTKREQTPLPSHRRTSASSRSG